MSQPQIYTEVDNQSVVSDESNKDDVDVFGQHDEM